MGFLDALRNQCLCPHVGQGTHAKKEVEAAVAIAKSSKEIDVAELTVDIYADSKEPIRNILPNKELKHSNQAKAINV